MSAEETAPGGGHAGGEPASMGTPLRLLPTPTGDPEWRDFANCVGRNPAEQAEMDAVMYPEAAGGRPKKGEQVGDKWAAARELCGDCPVAGDCLAFALQVEVPSYRFGMFGGFTPEERNEITGSVKKADKGELGEAPKTPKAGGAEYRCPACQQLASDEHVCSHKGWTHGTRKGYVHEKCRCEECRSWNRKYRRDRAIQNGWRGEHKRERHLTVVPDLPAVDDEGAAA